MSFYDIVETGADGSEVPFSTFQGSVIYGVNVASRCGYTASGYQLISRLAQTDGVVVLLFPCNQFGGQEPGSNQDVINFCVMKGGTGAIVLEKADVNGPNTRPTYQFIKSVTDMGDVRWNFAGKFLVDKNGNAFTTTDKTIDADIARMLAA